MRPKEKVLRDLEEEMRGLEQVLSAMGDIPAARVTHGIMVLAGILAEELGEPAVPP